MLLKKGSRYLDEEDVHDCLLLGAGGPHKPQGHQVSEVVVQFHVLHNSPHYLHVPKTPREVPNAMPSV